MILREGIHQLPQQLNLAEFGNRVQAVLLEIREIILDDVIAKCVEGINVHFIGIGTDKGKQTSSHRNGSGIGIGEAEYVGRVGICFQQYFSDTGTQDLGFSCSGTGDHHHGTFNRVHSPFLLRVEMPDKVVRNWSFWFIISLKSLSKLGNFLNSGILFLLFSRYTPVQSDVIRNMKNNQSFKVFIVEDDMWYGSMLEHYLSLNPEYEVKRFESPGDFFAHLHEVPDVVTLDYSLPDSDGTEVLRKIREFNPDIRVIIISGQEDVATAINLLKNGAFDYIVKDDDTKDRLWNSILHLREISNLKQEVESLKKQVGRKYDFSQIMIGNSEPMEKVFALIEKASKTNITVIYYRGNRFRKGTGGQGHSL